MVPPGQAPIGGAQSVSPSLLRSNSGMLGGQGGPLPSQAAFPSLMSPRTQFGNMNMNMLGNVPNVSSLLNQSFGNGGPTTGLSGPGSSQRGGIDTGAESDPLSGVANGMGFSAPSSSFVPSNMVNPGSSGQVQGQQFPTPSGNQLPDQQQSQQLDPQNFQHGQQPMQQFSAAHNTQQVQQQQQFQSVRRLAGVGAVKLEPQVTSDQHGQQQQQQQLPLSALAPVKLEPQQIQNIRNLPPVKLEPQHSDQSMFLHPQQQQQQQQQQYLHMSRQTTQAAAAQMNLLHQQRFLQLQHQHQQQQLLKAMPQQRPQLPQHFVQQQNLPMRSPVKPVYEPGMCARRLTHYMYQQQHRPEVRFANHEESIVSLWCMVVVICNCP